MRRSVLLLVLLASLGPARAQFQDLIQSKEEPALPRDVAVTLALRSVAVKDAVAKLAEAAGVKLTCAPALATRKVSLACREHAAYRVGAALARAAGGRWRKEGNTLVLVPLEPLDLLMPEELPCELSVAAVAAGLPRASEIMPIHRAIRAMFSTEQLKTAAGKGGLSVADLSAEQRQRIVSLLAADLPLVLHGVGQARDQLSQVQRATVKLIRDELEMVSPAGSTGVSLSTGSANQPR